MQIGIMAGAGEGPEGTVDGLIASAKRAEARGFAGMWLANIFGLDAITALALAGRETSRIELGTAVVPTYPRHPTAIAQQALTASAASGGRFTLGIGLSHKIVIENMLGFSYDKPARHMREYLSVLAPLLEGQPASFEGEQYKVQAGLQVQGASKVPLIVAALGDTMLNLAGRRSQGTITWMTGEKTLETHIGPKIREAAKAAGRPEPRVVAGFPIALTSDVDKAKEHVATGLQMYGTLPSYRAMLDKEGAAGPADIAILGDEAALRARLDQIRDAGATDFIAAVMNVEDGAADRTMDFLESLL